MAIFFGPAIANAQDWDTLGSIEQDRLIFSINSVSSVQNGPPNPSEFHLSNPTKITLIRTFHWNYGTGEDPGQSGWISIIDARNNSEKARLDVRYLERRGNVPNAYWVACGGDRFLGSGDFKRDLPALNIKLDAGTYQIKDSGQTTWSHNSDTRGRGIVFIYGI